MIKKEKLTTEQFNDLAEKSLWWKEISDEKDRITRVQTLDVPIEHKVIAIHALLENLFISEKKIRIAENNTIYKEAFEILSQMESGQKFPKRIYELSKLRLPVAKRNLSKIALELIHQFSTQNSKEKAEEIWKKNKKQFYFEIFEDLSKILQVDNSNDRYILRSLELVTYFYLYCSQKNYDPFEGEDKYNEATVEGSKYKRAAYLAYKVFNPLWERQLYRFEADYVKFPLKWAGSFLPLGFTEYLYSLYKVGKDVSAVFVSYYRDENKIYRLNDAIENCPQTTSFFSLFNEAIEAYREKRYKVSSVTFLSLIEGLIWEFAWEWNQIHGSLFSPNISKEQYSDTTTFQILKPDGSKIGGRPNIGNLLRKTAFGDELYVEMIEFLCEELFDERNSVLHGRKPNFGDLKKASTLLFVIETIERAITSNIKKELGKIIEKQLTINPS